MPCAGLLEVDAVIDAVEVDVDVATDRAVDAASGEVRRAPAGVGQHTGRLAHDLDDPRDRREVLPVRHLVTAADQLPGELGRQEIVQQSWRAGREDLVDQTDDGPEKSTVGTPRSAVDQGPATPSRNDNPTTSSSMRKRSAPLHRRAASTNSPSALHAAASSSAVNITKPPSSTTPDASRHIAAGQQPIVLRPRRASGCGRSSSCSMHASCWSCILRHRQRADGTPLARTPAPRQSQRTARRGACRKRPNRAHHGSSAGPDGRDGRGEEWCTW